MTTVNWKIDEDCESNHQTDKHDSWRAEKATQPSIHQAPLETHISQVNDIPHNASLTLFLTLTNQNFGHQILKTAQTIDWKIFGSYDTKLGTTIL